MRCLATSAGPRVASSGEKKSSTRANGRCYVAQRFEFCVEVVRAAGFVRSTLKALRSTPSFPWNKNKHQSSRVYIVQLTCVAVACIRLVCVRASQVNLGEQRVVTAILVLCGLPYASFSSVLAHEATHAWMKLDPSFPTHLPAQVRGCMHAFMMNKHTCAPDCRRRCW